MPLTSEHFRRIRAAEAELKAAYQAAANEMPGKGVVRVKEGEKTSTWCKSRDRFEELPELDPVTL